MQEGSVTAGGESRELGDPFLVFATQNPIEQEGTYPLPEAQLDRFMLMIEVGYPSADEEIQIVNLTTGSDSTTLKSVLSRLLKSAQFVGTFPLHLTLSSSLLSSLERTTNGI